MRYGQAHDRSASDGVAPIEVSDLPLGLRQAGGTGSGLPESVVGRHIEHRVRRVLLTTAAPNGHQDKEGLRPGTTEPYRNPTTATPAPILG
jgi:hypothetical protein